MNSLRIGGPLKKYHLKGIDSGNMISDVLGVRLVGWGV